MGPSISEANAKTSKNFDGRFSGPLGFQTKVYKRKFRERYPRTFIALFSGTCLSLFYSRFIYEIFREPGPEELQQALEQKQRMIDSGFWYSPFGVKRD